MAESCTPVSEFSATTATAIAEDTVPPSVKLVDLSGVVINEYQANGHVLSWDIAESSKSPMIQVGAPQGFAVGAGSINKGDALAIWGFDQHGASAASPFLVDAYAVTDTTDGYSLEGTVCQP